ncbi:hypothetical protein BJ684DRAFT_18529 [Piptocephalis cylindrospora]|uniref:Vacuolar protein sorting-associated protein 51 homolog n=1 Tax=Piptocephalis cylindrospora TaxID=1907219 RepID=A0A4P9Y8J7_9FUNG|nr:hypothetical protein BJ684DRAFT_18529 [Piptocephalis cylindrospora]|eukprot:RKP15114.1 hypothetical protein BJ684DRAFT_18529 [Piptocephalis cylindrospora]
MKTTAPSPSKTARPSPSSVHPTPKGTGRRTRNLLKNYYGIQEEGVVPTLSNPLDVDSKGFDAGQARTKYLRTKGIGDLVRLDNKLVSDIRELDGDSKTLVYENYGKFINATESIHHMSKGLSDMVDTLKGLEVTLGTAKSEQVNMLENMADRRSHLRTLHAEHDRLSKLADILTLPSTLGERIHCQDLVGAVSAYVSARPSLEEHASLAGVQQLSRESREIVGRMERNLLSSLLHQDASIQEMTRCVGLCSGLATKPLDLLQSFLKQAHGRLEEATTGRHQRTMSRETNLNGGEDRVGSTMDGEERKVEEEGEEGKGWVPPPEWFSITLVSREDTKAIQERIKDFSSHWIKIYLALLKDCLDLPAYEGLCHAYPNCLPLWRIDPETGRLYAECVGAWESAYVAGIFQRISSDFEGSFSIFLEDRGSSDLAMPELYEFVVREETCLTDALAMEGLERFEAFQSSGMSYLQESDEAAEQFRGIVRQGLGLFWEKIMQFMGDFARHGPKAWKCAPQGILVLANLAMDFESAAVMATAEAFSQRLCPTVAMIGERGWWSPEDRQAWAVWEEEAIGTIDRCGQVAQSLLQMYVDKVSGKMIHLYRASLVNKDWEGMGKMEVHGPSEDSWKPALEAMSGAERDVIVLFGDDDELEGIRLSDVDGEDGEDDDDDEGTADWMDDEVSETQSVSSKASRRSRRPTHLEAQRRSRTRKSTSSATSSVTSSPAMSSASLTPLSVGTASMTSRRRLRGLTSPTAISPSPTHHSTPSPIHPSTAYTTSPGLGMSVPMTPGGGEMGSLEGGEGGGIAQSWLQPIGRLFMERVEVYGGEVEVNRVGLMRSISLAVAKAWGEEARSYVYGMGGLRQTQVDVTWVRDRWASMLGEDGGINALLDEVLAGVYRRCIDPRPLDARRARHLAGLDGGDSRGGS